MLFFVENESTEDWQRVSNAMEPPAILAIISALSNIFAIIYSAVSYVRCLGTPIEKVSVGVS